MRKSVTWMLVTITILATLGFSFAVENDYIAVSGQPKLTHTEKINSGDPYTAEVTLTRIGIIPRQATLNISTSAVNPIIKLTIDGEEQTSTTQIVSQELAEEGVSVIEIKISGNAPTVSTDTQSDMVSVVSYVVYDDLNKGPQEEIIRSLIVTNPDIEEAVRTINDAKRKLLEAETAISDLKAQDRDTSSLESRLEVNRDLIRDAENSKARGFPIESKRQADNAIISLNGVITDAQAMTQRVYDIKTYATVAVVIIIALIGISVLRRKREELG
jgi:hypothetical protein